MEIRRVPMSMEDFHLLPFHPGWKVELMNGEALFQPREACAFGKVAVQIRSPSSPVQMREPAAEDAPELLRAFRAAFADATEFCGYPAAAFEKECRRNIDEFFSGKHGGISGASRVATGGPGGADDGAIIGAALIRELDEESTMLDVLLVSPNWRRRGIATAMCRDALGRLAAQGKRWLITSWHLGNEPSMAWHRKFGFVEEPDLSNARLYLRAARQELHRLEKLGPWDENRARELGEEIAAWEHEAYRLEVLREAGDEAGAFAWSRYRF